MNNNALIEWWFSRPTLVSSTNITESHNITEIFLKVECTLTLKIRLENITGKIELEIVNVFK
jgi:hypothetical protein